MQIQLDHARLEKLKPFAGGFRAACPACRLDGSDKQGQHLRIFADESWGCAVSPKDREHARRIIELAGITPDKPADPAETARRAREVARQRAAQEKATADRRNRARRALVGILRDYEWALPDVWEDSSVRIENGIDRDERFFIASLFPQDATVWAGHRHDSGKPKHAANFQTAAEWSECQHLPGPLLSPAIWKPGTISRSVSNVVSNPFIVADFDQLPGRDKPTTDAEVAELHQAALGITRWLTEVCRWKLAAILSTGGRGLHCWFHRPANLAAVKNELTELGFDPAAFGAAQTARAPGWKHERTGRMSRVMWLKNPA